MIDLQSEINSKNFEDKDRLGYANQRGIQIGKFLRFGNVQNSNVQSLHLPLEDCTRSAIDSILCNDLENYTVGKKVLQ